MPNSDPEKTASAPKNYAKYILFAAGCLGLIVVLWAALVHRSNQVNTSCPFRVNTYSAGDGSVKNPIAKDACVQLARITTPEAQKEGLSGRQSMKDTEGLLFDFGVPGSRCMWMKDMLFSIDMIWLDTSQTITTIKENVSPDTFPESFCGTDKDAYVIEVNAGVVKEAKLSVGQQLKL